MDTELVLKIPPCENPVSTLLTCPDGVFMLYSAIYDMSWPQNKQRFLNSAVERYTNNLQQQNSH